MNMIRATEHGYVYFPGRTEEWYRLNVSTIFPRCGGKVVFALGACGKAALPDHSSQGLNAEAHVK